MESGAEIRSGQHSGDLTSGRGGRKEVDGTGGVFLTPSSPKESGERDVAYSVVGGKNRNLVLHWHEC